MTALPKSHLSVAHFLELYADSPERFELMEGQPYMMGGGSARHNRVCRNINAQLYLKLKGSPCESFPEMGLKADWDILVYPDAAIYCNPMDLECDDTQTQSFEHPQVLFEILSPSTRSYDLGAKAHCYLSIASVKAVVIVDPIARSLITHVRIGPESWQTTMLPVGSDLVLADPALTLTAAEIFDLT
jgi:Uma2 family endonuclease